MPFVVQQEPDAAQGGAREHGGNADNDIPNAEAPAAREREPRGNGAQRDVRDEERRFESSEFLVRPREPRLGVRIRNARIDQPLKTLAQFPLRLRRRPARGGTSGDRLPLHQFAETAAEDRLGHSGSVVESPGGFNTKLFSASGGRVAIAASSAKSAAC